MRGGAAQRCAASFRSAVETEARVALPCGFAAVSGAAESPHEPPTDASKER